MRSREPREPRERLELREEGIGLRRSAAGFGGRGDRSRRGRSEAMATARGRRALNKLGVRSRLGF